MIGNNYIEINIYIMVTYVSLSVDAVLGAHGQEGMAHALRPSPLSSSSSSISAASSISSSYDVLHGLVPAPVPIPL